MSYRIKKILVLLITAMFMMMEFLAMIPESVYADVGSISAGEDITYDKDGGVLASMGFDTSKMPDTYDPDATTNPYGADVSTMEEVDEGLFFDLSKPIGGNYAYLYGHNRKLNGSYEEFINSPIRKSLGNGDVSFLMEDDFVSSVKCDITGDGRDSAVAIVSTHYNIGTTYPYYDIYLSLYNPVNGNHSDRIKVSDLHDAQSAGRLTYNYQVQSQLQITAGDFDKDSVDEIAVYSPGNENSERNKVMIFDLTDGKECEDPYNISSWRHSWNYMLPNTSEKVINVSVDKNHPKFASNIYNNVDLTSGDADNDGIEDLIVSYGASDTDYAWGAEYSEASIKRSIPSRSVLLYGSDTGQALRDSQMISYGGQDLIRVSFAFGDVDADGNEDMFFAGQRQSEQDENNTRVLGRYVYDKDAKEMALETIQNMAVVNGTMTDTDGDGTDDKFASANGWDEMYYSMPLMKANLAVGNILGNANDVKIYLDSVLYSYDSGNFEIADELEDDSKDDENKPKGSGVFAGDNAIKGYRGSASKASTYFEYDTECVNLTASPSDHLLVNRVSTRRGLDIGNGAEVTATASILYADNNEALNRHDPIHEGTEFSGVEASGEYSGSPVVAFAADTDKDGLVAEYTGEHDIQYQDPAVLAVLASPPYFKDVAAYDENDMLVYLNTEYGSSSGTESGHENVYECQVGVHVSNHIGSKAVFGIANLGAGYAREETWGWEKEREFKMSYETEGGEDAVVMYSVPTENYIYKVRGVTVDDDGDTEEFTNTMVVTKPHKPVTQTLALEDYVEIQKRYSDKLPDVTKYLTSTPGDPSSYPSSQNDLSDEAKSHIDWDTEHPIDYGEKWAGVAFGDGSITQELSYSYSERDRYDNHLDGGWGSIEGGAGWEENLLFHWQSLEAVAVYDFSQMHGSTYATLTGADCSGTIKNMPRSAKGYGYDFSWKLLKYNIKDKGCTFPVVTYIVNDVTAPPVLPETIEQDFEASTDSQIVLDWTYSTGNPQGFDIYRYKDFPIGGGTELIGTVNGSDYKIMKDEEGNTLRDKDGHVVRGYSFTDTGLTADTKYQYRMKVRTSKLPGESIFSPIIDARTDVGTKPALSLTSDDLKIYPDGTYNVKVTLDDPENYQSDIDYQWQKYNTKKRKWEDIEGCDKQVLHFYNCTPKDAGSYRCRVNLIRSVESNPQYISAFTEACNVSFSFRSVKFGDITVFDGRGNSRTNTGLYVNVQNTSARSLEKPTGMVIFTITGPNGTFQVAGYIDEETGDVNIESIEDRIEDLDQKAFIDGGYVITCSYEGNAIFYPAEDPEEYHYLRNIDEDIFLSLKSSYYFGENIADTIGLFDYQTTISGKLNRTDLTDKITTLKFYKVAANGTDKTGEAIAEYDMTKKEAEAPVPLHVDLAKKAYVEAYMEGSDEPASGKVIQTRKVPIEISIKNKTTGTGELLKFLDKDDVEISNGIDVDEENILTGESEDKSLADFILFRYYEQNSDYICDSDNTGSHKNEFIPASYNTAVTLKSADNEDEPDPYWFYTPTFKGGRFMVVGNYYLISAGPSDKSTGSVRMISPDSRTDFEKEGYVGGTKIILKAEPNPGYEINKWIVDDCGNKTTYTGTTNFTFTVRSQNTSGDSEVTITAVMTPKNNRIRIGQIGEGEVSVTPDIDSGDNVLAGTKLKFTADPADGWRFEEWRWTTLGGDNIVSAGVTDEDGNNTKEFTMPDNSAEVYALFARDTVDVMASDGLEVLYVNNGGDPYHDEGELVKTEKGKNVPKGASVIVRTKPGKVLAPGAAFNVLITDSDGNIIDPVTIDYNAMSQGRQACTFDLPEDADTCIVSTETAKGVYTVYAETEGVEFEISVDGDVVEGSTAEGIVSGSQVDIKAKPTERGQQIASWIINGEEKASNDTIYTCNIEENMSVAVTTKPKDSYTMNLSAEGGGILECIISDPEGHEQTIQVEGDAVCEEAVYPDESILFRSSESDDEYTLTSITVNGEKKELDEGTYSIADVDENISVQATFSPNTYFSVKMTSHFGSEKSLLLNKSEDIIESGESARAAKGSDFSFKVAVPAENQPYVKVTDNEGQSYDLEAQGDPEDYGESGMKLYNYSIDGVVHDLEIIVTDHGVKYISTPDDLKDYFDEVLAANANGYCEPDGILTQDIDMSGLSINQDKWISDLHSTFNGNGYTISNLQIQSRNFRGIFGDIRKTAEIKDVVFKDLTVRYRPYEQMDTGIGLLGITNRGTISRVSLINSLFNVRYNSSGEMSNGFKGGLVCNNYGAIEYCLVDGLGFSMPSTFTGSLAGGASLNGNGSTTASMTGNYFKDIYRLYSSDDRFILKSNIIVVDHIAPTHQGSFTSNYFLQKFDGTGTADYELTNDYGTNVLTLSENMPGTEAAEQEVETKQFFKRLAYLLNKDLSSAVYGVSRDDAEDTEVAEDANVHILPAGREDVRYYAPIKVEYMAGGKTTTYIPAGETVLPGEEVFGTKTPKAWEVGDRAYPPKSTIDIQNDIRIIGLGEDDFGEYTATLSPVNGSGERIATVYYKDVNDAIRDAMEYTSLLDKLELDIIGNAKLSGESFTVHDTTTVTVKDGAELTISKDLQINNQGTLMLEQGATVHKYGSLLNEGVLVIPAAEDDKGFYNYGSAFDNRGIVTEKANIICKPHLYGDWTYADAPDDQGRWMRTRTCTVCEHEDEQEVTPNPSAEDIDHIELKSEPDNTVYEVGEKFSDKGLSVTAVLKSGIRAAVTEYVLALQLDGEDEQKIENGDTMDTEGTGKVVVNYEGFSTEFDITVMNTAELLTMTGSDGEPAADMEMEPADTSVLNASLKQKLSYKTIFVWESSDESVISIAPNGTGTSCSLIAGEPGTATVTVYVTDESGNPIQKINARSIEVSVVSHITGIEIPGGDISLDKGETQKIDLSLTPENTTDKVEWTSSDEETATVEEDGTVKAVGGGKAVITVTAPNGLKDSITVFVNEKAEDLTVDPEEITTREGEFDVVRAKASNVRANGEVVWTTSDSEKAAFYVRNEETGEMEIRDTVTTVLSADGTDCSDAFALIAGLGTGEAVITAATKSKSGDMIESTCEITVRAAEKYVHITHNGARISGEELVLDLSGKYIQLGAESSEEEDDSLEWTSIDDENDPVIKVDKATGKVTFRRKGTAAVKVTSTLTGESDVCLITVVIRPEGVQLADSEVKLQEGDTYKLIAELLPEGSEGSLIWKSSNEKVATVSKDGRITAVAEGKATITVVPDYDGAEAATCNVTVYGKKQPVPTKLTVTLSKKTFTCTSKKQIPKVTVKCGSTVLGKGITKSNSKVILMFSDNRSMAPGTYKVVAVSRDGSYGAGEASYKIRMKNTALKKLKKGKKKFTVKWKKLGKKYASGYQIRYSLKKSMKKSKFKTVNGGSKSKVTVKKLKGRKKYYVQVRSFVKCNGVRYYSKWSAKKSIKTRK